MVYGDDFVGTGAGSGSGGGGGGGSGAGIVATTGTGSGSYTGSGSNTGIGSGSYTGSGSISAIAGIGGGGGAGGGGGGACDTCCGGGDGCPCNGPRGVTMTGPPKPNSRDKAAVGERSIMRRVDVGIVSVMVTSISRPLERLLILALEPIGRLLWPALKPGVCISWVAFPVCVLGGLFCAIRVVAHNNPTKTSVTRFTVCSFPPYTLSIMDLQEKNNVF